MKFSVTVDMDEDGRNRGLSPVYPSPVYPALFTLFIHGFDGSGIPAETKYNPTNMELTGAEKAQFLERPS